MAVQDRQNSRQPARVIAALGLTIAVLLSGCGSRDTSRLALVAIGAPADPFATGIDRPFAGQLARASTAEGLVSFDEQGRVVPALADRWIVTDDGKSYIFRLRDGEWRDGEPLTARSAKTALDAALRALRKTSMGLDFAPLDEVRTMAGRVIEIRLHRPMPYFLQLLAQPELVLLHEGRGAGPMIIEREGEVARFTAIQPARLGLPEVPDWDSRVRQLEMTALPADLAVQRFNDGAADLVLGGRIQDFPLTSSVGILRGTIQLDPVVGLFGLQVASTEGFLADPGNREALAMAIDRTALIAPFGVSGWSETTRLISPGLEGVLAPIGERWTDMNMAQRRAAAASRVSAWTAASGNGSEVAPARVAIWLPPGPGSDILFNRLVEDFRAIGVSATRARDSGAADLRLVDEVARYPRARWFLNRLSCVARKGPCVAEADAMVAESIRIESEAERADRLSQAEARLTQANLFIPFGTPIRWSLARGNVQGFATNPWAWHPLMPLAWVHK